MKERSSYQRQVLLAIIPIIGILVVWQLVCNNMMKVTKNYWYIFLAYLFCIILLSFIGGIVYITIICLHIDLESLQNKIFIAAMLGIIASIVIAMSFIISESVVLDLYKRKIENQSAIYYNTKAKLYYRERLGWLLSVTISDSFNLIGRATLEYG